MKPAMTGPHPKRDRTVERTCGWRWGLWFKQYTPGNIFPSKKGHVQKKSGMSSNHNFSTWHVSFWGNVVAGKDLQQWIVVRDTKTSHMCNKRNNIYIIPQRVFGGVLGKDLQQWIVIVVVDVVVGDTIYDQSHSSCSFWNKTRQLL